MAKTELPAYSAIGYSTTQSEQLDTQGSASGGWTAISSSTAPLSTGDLPPALPSALIPTGHADDRQHQGAAISSINGVVWRVSSEFVTLKCQTPSREIDIDVPADV